MTTPADLPRPPMTPAARRAVYALWAWASLLLGALIVGWAVVGDVPVIVLAVSTALNFIGAGAGFLARDHVDMED